MLLSVAISLYTPSIITRGSLPPVKDVVPRTRTELSIAIRSLPTELIFTPAACPLNAPNELMTSPLFIRPSPIISTEPSRENKSLFRADAAVTVSTGTLRFCANPWLLNATRRAVTTKTDLYIDYKFIKIY